MAFVGGIRLEGADRLLRQLLKVERNVRVKISRRAVREGAKIIHKAVRKEAPKRTGFLSQSYKIVVGKRKSGEIKFRIETQDGDFKGDAFYGAFVEYGHFVGHRRLGKNRRYVEPNYFTERAFNKSKAHAQAAIIKSLRHGLLMSTRIGGGFGGGR